MQATRTLKELILEDDATKILEAAGYTPWGTPKVEYSHWQIGFEGTLVPVGTLGV